MFVVRFVYGKYLSVLNSADPAKIQGQLEEFFANKTANGTLQ